VLLSFRWWEEAQGLAPPQRHGPGEQLPCAEARACGVPRGCCCQHRTIPCSCTNAWTRAATRGAGVGLGVPELPWEHPSCSQSPLVCCWEKPVRACGWPCRASSVWRAGSHSPSTAGSAIRRARRQCWRAPAPGRARGRGAAGLAAPREAGSEPCVSHSW